MDKEKFFSNDTWNERSKKKKWKRFYQIRNSTYLNHHYGRNIAVKYLRGFNGVMGYIFIVLFTSPFAKAYQWKDIPPIMEKPIATEYMKTWNYELKTVTLLPVMFHNKLAFIYYIYRKRVNLLYN